MSALLPAPDGPAPAAAAERGKGLAGILLVDDHPGNLLALEALLDDPDYRLVKATSGPEALKCLLDQEFAVILMDVKMPGMDGFQTASIVRGREQTRHVPIIFLTAVDMSPSHVSKGYSVGAVDYLIKPFDPSILRSKVRGLVDLYRDSRRRSDDSDRLRRLAQEEHRTQVEELKLQRDRFFSLSRDMMCVLGAEGIFQEANAAWERDLGLDARALKGKPFLALFPSEDRPRISRYWERLAAERGFVGFEARVLSKDGRSRWLSWSLIAFPGEGRFYGVARDISDRIRAEEELRRHERELDDFFESASIGILWASPDGTVLRANRAQLEMLGRPADDVVGRDLRRFHDDPAWAEELLGRLARGEAVHDFPGVLRRADGTLRDVLIDADARLESGRLVQSRSFVRDVTAQRQAERRSAAQKTVSRILEEAATLEEAARPLLETLCESLQWDAGVLWRPSRRGGLLEAAGAWSSSRFGREADLAGLRPGEEGDRVADRVVATGAYVWIPDLRTGPANPRPALDGVCSVAAFPVLADAGRICVLELMASDVRLHDESAVRLLYAVGSQFGQFVERRRAEEAMRERTANIIRHQSSLLELAGAERLELSEALLAIAETAARTTGADRVGFWTFEDEGKALVCRARYDASARSATAPARMELRSPSSYRPALQAAGVLAADDAASDPRLSEFREGGPGPEDPRSLLDVAVNHHGRAAGILRFEMRDAPRRWTVEEQEYGFAVADRVALSLSSHERRLAEEEIRRLNVELEARVERRTEQYLEALEEQEQFAYSVSHDLRAPLRAMHGFSQALLQDHGRQLDAMGREFARRITEAAGRMEILIKDLLEYSRLSRSEIPLAAVSLDRVVEQVLRDAQAELKERRGEVEVRSPLGEVAAHEVTLVQVVTNLLGNALKFVPKGKAPRVVLRTEPRDARLRLWVEDNGIGIEPAYHERIFRVFERLNRAEDFPGTGIGLAIVRKAILRMGGAAGVVSDGREGSRFWVELDRPGGRP